MFLLETERLKEQIQQIQQNLDTAKEELKVAGTSYDDMKEEYEAIEKQVDEIDAAIEKSKGQLNETNLLKQQLENQIELLKEQINSAKMSDEHYGQRFHAIQIEIGERTRQLEEFQREKDAISGELKEKKKIRGRGRASTDTCTEQDCRSYR